MARGRHEQKKQHGNYLQQLHSGAAGFNTTLNRNGKTTAEIMALSAREKEVLQLIAEGYTSLEISQKLYVSKKTVDNHRARIMEKTSIKTISGLTKFAIQEGLSDLKFINKTLK
ncbi:MAG: LuxR C-terminal-related transcriptional regulator [Thermodesulfobacteriota bacterium]|nr:LuxR C-terminal-related transcriptional regulator [Thermodesulfobacteriota bacterium]